MSIFDPIYIDGEIDTKLKSLVLNRLSKDKFDELSSHSPDEIWFIQDSELSGQPIVVDTRPPEKVKVPTKTSQLENDSGFAYQWDIRTNTDQLENGAGFITSAYVAQNASKTIWADWSVTSSLIDYADYINTNHADFDTGVTPTTTTRIECRLRGDAMGNWFVGTTGQEWRFFNAETTFYFDWNYSRIEQGTWSIGSWYDISAGNWWFNVVPVEPGPDTLYQNGGEMGDPYGGTLHIGDSQYQYGSQTGESFDVEFIKIWQGDTLTKDYRPAFDPSGVACFYEEVSHQYEYPYNGTWTANYF